ncbi:polycystic kidney disease protein 1-like 3 isoform X2 [Phoenix dactylifera]|uniref:Polycystic kidney disease protein 1-like 3 isoform X2 n=1 Tax=Phoenix dactylifera TaxID=42345 RepID=A0A8B9A328_PHODC|nr:polycystic kidney disease protein 1-like 3 isoform X2 [Phoenix dactylifera]
MAKQHKVRKHENIGKGKVTPVQIAFIVDRYLADNNYTDTLAAFRAEASDLFSKTKGKEVPKGLLGLGEILDEYISLKEKRMMVDQEKWRVEMALQGMQDVMLAYHSAGPPALPPPPPLLPPQFVATPVAPLLPASYHSSGSPPGCMVNGAAAITNAQPATMLTNKAAEPPKFSTPIPNSSYANKRKASKSAPRVPPATKKSCTQPSAESSVTGGISLPSQVTPPSDKQDSMETSAFRSASINNPIVSSPVQGSAVARSLFKQPLEPQANSSPKTPPQPLPSQADKSVSPPENTSCQITDASILQDIPSSNCTLISSETIIVSPLKVTGYYAIERSYHINSPYKSNSKKMSRREHVKGRLDFDNPDVQMGSEVPVAIDGSTSTSSSEGEISESFDLDLPDFDIFNGDFSFSELLADIDLDCERIPSCQLPTDYADLIPGFEENAGNGCLETNKVLPDFSMSTVSGVLSEDLNIQDSVMSVRTLTKRVKILKTEEIAHLNKEVHQTCSG